MIWTDEIPFFPKTELQCKCGCEIVRLDRRFAVALSNLRLEWNRPLTPTSVCRCPKHNVAVGGHLNSMHLTMNARHHGLYGTAAADISWRNWSTQDKQQFYNLARSLKFACGLHDGFLHVDRRIDVGLPPTTFLYGTWSAPFNHN